MRYLFSSNQKKLGEYREFGLEDVQLFDGPDLKEVLSSASDVIMYKALEAGSFMQGRVLVDDTYLEVDGEELVDIKWQIDSVRSFQNRSIVWVVNIGENDGSFIRIFSGRICCEVKNVLSVPENAFGFDPFLVPVGQSETLYELAQKGQKSIFSARRIAIEKIMNNSPDLIVEIDTIPKWNGAFQNE